MSTITFDTPQEEAQMPVLEDDTTLDTMDQIRAQVLHLLEEFSHQELCSSSAVCDGLLDLLILTGD